MSATVSALSTKFVPSLERSVSNPGPKKRRAAKRRGRAKDEFESDDEIEREVRTDSETDDDNCSIDSDSDSESSSNDLHEDPHSEVVTPSTTQSPPVEPNGLPHIAPKNPSTSQAGIFADATNWAEMVAGETENGVADLPVIDFADMDPSRLEPHAPSPPPPRSRKTHKQAKKSSTARSTSAPPLPATPTAFQPQPAEGAPVAEEPVASTSHEPIRTASPTRARGQTARQAYQQRLESDPSFVPKVGGFWGHDDRLYDKELRSLSGWWRGRWQSRGHGRGTFSMRGRGRGFHLSHFSPRDEGDVQEGAAEVPPVEKLWTHDGFEEMKKRDERRRLLHEQQHNNPPQRGFGFRGRTFVPVRGRGGVGRGGSFSPPPSQPSLSNTISMGDRVWYPQKPERMWTKQHDSFLYNDITTKARPGVGPGVRVKLPGGKTPLVVRLPPRSYAARSVEKPEETPVHSEVDKLITVRIPGMGKAKAAEECRDERQGGELATTVEELSIEEVFTVRPNAVPKHKVDLSAPSSSVSIDLLEEAASTGLNSPPPPPSSMHPVMGDIWNPIEQLSTLPATDGRSSPSAEIQETILRKPPTSGNAISSSLAHEQDPHTAPPALHSLQTSFSPVPPTTSPPYGSPYGYASALPPGVAVNHQGMPYEYVTGRPVYIQPTPPPMYTPRPMLHGHHPSVSMPFVPSHLRHHSSASPDFLAHPHPPHPHTPPISFVDPTTGVPIFSPARQSSRVEIRAPTGAIDGKKLSRPSHPRSTLSSSVAISATEEAQPNPYFLQQGEAADSSQEHSQAPSMESAVGYPSYQQPYYYPEQYGYAPYVDMPHQMMRYDVYQPEHPQHQHPPSQPIVYY